MLKIIRCKGDGQSKSRGSIGVRKLKDTKILYYPEK
uniref:Uncharacterized protein n=1 Tax=Myoviridae sp. ctp7F23 TaxID=2825174 RepID=A0A8S5U8N0_9CAUD|nr:MAG TPA: hypothetical protein [Myoviridae sp. ctp7F23]